MNQIRLSLSPQVNPAPRLKFDHSVRTLAWSPSDNRTLLAVLDDNTLRIGDVSKGMQGPSRGDVVAGENMRFFLACTVFLQQQSVVVAQCFARCGSEDLRAGFGCCKMNLATQYEMVYVKDILKSRMVALLLLMSSSVSSSYIDS